MSPSETDAPFSAESKAVYSCKDVESRIAAYIGLQSTTELRHFCFAWPLLRIIPKIKEQWKGLQRWKILISIQDSDKHLPNKKITDPYFAPDESDTQDQQAMKRKRSTAWCLLNLRRDFAVYKESPDEENSQKAQKYLGPCLQALFSEQETIPECVSVDRVTWPKPDLGPFEGETELECFNRLCEVLKMLEYISKYPEKWLRRFGNEKALNSGKPVGERDLPAWMRSKPQHDEPSKTDNPIEGVQQTREFHFIELPFVVAQESSPEAEELDRHLENLENQDRLIPPTKGIISIDPAACSSGEVFRDAIRRSLGTSEVGINLLRLKLSFVDNSIDDSPSRQSLDVLTDGWDEIQSSLQSPSNRNFQLRIAFKLQDDMPVFESDSLPPWLESDYLPPWIKDRQAETSADKGKSPARSQTPAASAPSGQIPLEKLLRSANVFRGKDDKKDWWKPRPKYSTNTQKQRAYYNDHAIGTHEGLLAWHQEILQKLSRGGKGILLQRDNAVCASKEAELALKSAEQTAIHNAESSAPFEQSAQEDYLTLQRPFTGSDSRAGPPLDVCLDLLCCTLNEDTGRYRATVLKNAVRSEFYHYQINGAVGICMKLLGSIDPMPLITFGKLAPDGKKAKKLKKAAANLSHLCIHGAILADDTGFGKTKISLLALLLYCIIARPKKPNVLLVPGTLIAHWLTEIKRDWPFFHSILSYSDHAFTDALGAQRMTKRQMAQPRSAPPEFRYLFEGKEIRAGQAIIISTRDTHWARTSWTEKIKIGGKPYDPPKFEKGKHVWKVPPQTKTTVETDHEGLFGVVIVDEAQTVKNRSTRIWHVLALQKFEKVFLLTATPVFNSIRRALEDLDARSDDKDLQKNVQKLRSGLGGGIEETRLALQSIAPTDLSRAYLLEKKVLDTWLLAKKNQHLQVAQFLTFALDLVVIQRSQASTLPALKTAPVSLRNLCKEASLMTADASFLPDELTRYQMLHHDAACEYTEEFMSKEDTRLKTGEFVRPRFFTSAGPLRRLTIASLSTRLALLNHRISEAGADTFSTRLVSWREHGHADSFIWTVANTAGGDAPKTGLEMLKFLTDGSPALRLIFHLLKQWRILEPPSESYAGHQKMIIAVSVPVSAWFLEVVFQTALIGAAVFHSGLTHEQRIELTEEFNDRKSSLKLLIMTYDVGAVGLNLHEACNRVLILDPAISRAAESQLAGRALRVTSRYPLTIMRCNVPNSHHSFRIWRQAQKASLQLAVNAQDKSISDLMLRELNRLQVRVNRCHESDEGKDLLERLSNPQDSYAAIFGDLMISTNPESSQKKRGRSEDVGERSAKRQAVGNLQQMPDEDSNSEGQDTDSHSDFSSNEADDEDEWDDEIPRDAGEDVDDEGQGTSPLATKQEGSLFQKIDDWNDFINIEQPSDSIREKMSLVSLTYGKVWTHEDLKTQYGLELGLLLLYNLSRGTTTFHLTRSIHIEYTSLPKKRLEAGMKLGKREKAKIRNLVKD